MKTISKKCSKCGDDFPATTDYFRKATLGEFGLRANCKECDKKYFSKRYKDNRIVLNKKRTEWRNASEANKEKDRKKYNKWRENNPEEYKKHCKKYKKSQRLKALQKITNGGILVCNRCGCDMIDILEINHINGGGTKERCENKNFISDILHNRRTIDDLELLCKLCNNLHYIEMIHGKLNFKIIWEKEER